MRFISKRWVKGGILATIGYLLSPLSFWNDAFINIPIAYVLGFICGLFSQKLFLPAMIIGYWITNIVGLVLLHKGASEVISEGRRKYGFKSFFKDLIVSIVYSAIIVILVRYGILKFSF